MHPRVAYWLSSFEPEMEAIASEVALLRRTFTRSVAWGLSVRHWALFSRRRGFCLHPRLQLPFRLFTRLLEPAFHLNHVFGSLGDWTYLEGRRQRPTVLTLAVAAPPVERSVLDRVDVFVAEDPINEQILHRMGIHRDRIRLIHAPVDLERFRPAPKPTARFTVLFASSPERHDWLEARGVLLLLKAASLRPEMRFRLLWRPWGDSLPHVERLIRELALTNVDLVAGCESDMVSQFQGAHATVAPFVNMECCKSSPNSLLESLACGRPIVATGAVGVASLAEENRAGLTCRADPESLAECLDRLEADWHTYSMQARKLAVQLFDARTFVESYTRLYAELMH